MNGNEGFVGGFLKRGGGYVLGSGVLVKVALVSSIAVARMVDQIATALWLLPHVNHALNPIGWAVTGL